MPRPGDNGGMTTSDNTAPVIDFWFDPACPWTWMTSRWMVEVQRQRDVEVRWHVLSLAVLNEGRDLDPEYRKSTDRTWRAARVVVGAEQEHGPEVVLPLYTAIGERHHPGGRNGEREVLVEALAEVGLPADLVDRAETGEFDEAMRASTKAALDLVGDDVGVPVVSVDGVAFFGPVVSPAPKGDDALSLFDGCVAAARVPGFFELKRSRNVDPIFD